MDTQIVLELEEDSPLDWHQTYQGNDDISHPPWKLYDWMVPEVPVWYWVQPSGAFHSAVHGIWAMWIENCLSKTVIHGKLLSLSYLLESLVQVFCSVLQVLSASRYRW